MTNKLLVLYVFHEYNERVDWFIKNAITGDRLGINYTPSTHLLHSLQTGSPK